MKRGLNHCFSNSCPAPRIPFSEGEYVVIRIRSGRRHVKHYHPICANEKNIVY